MKPTATASISDHLGYAEHGKQLALAGRHREALAAYRAAMAGASSEDPHERLLCRHYTECALESLEHLGSYDTVLAYCEQALEHYRQNPPTSLLAHKDLASLHLRIAAIKLKQKDTDSARHSLRIALDQSREHGFSLPLAVTLARWIDAHLNVSPERVQTEQTRHHYFAVRSDTFRPERVTLVPSALLNVS